MLRRPRMIPSLRAVAEAARKHAPNDPELATALDEYDLSQELDRKQRAEILAERGQACVECGRRFVSYDGDPCCSIGCRLG